MATTTTHYGFDIPQSTDLVKDGATAIATLGQDIDTAMNTALGTNKAGLVLLNTTSFSGVSSQSVNDVFSSTYTNYQIVFNYTGSNNASFNLRMRVGGADDTGTNYARQFSLATNTTYLAGRSSTASSYAISDSSGSNLRANPITYVFNPNLAVPTTFRTMTGFANDSNTAIFIMDTNGNHQLSTAYTGFTAFVDTGTMTGNLQVYGLNK